MKKLLLCALSLANVVGLAEMSTTEDSYDAVFGFSSRECVRDFARFAAASGIVLLKNEGQVLPLAKGEEVALLGVTSYYCHRMGWGSGDMMKHVPVQYSEGLEQAGIRLFRPMVELFNRKPKDYDRINKDWWKWTSRFDEPLAGVTDEGFAKLCGASRSMKCLVTIGRNSGESADIPPGPGGWMLHGQEERLLKLACANFDDVIVLLNVAGPIDTSWLDKYPVKGVVLTSLLGEVSGLAVADVLTGSVNPSGKLAATWARRYRDYPTTDCFGTMEVPFNEGIYVGYRYFDSFDVEPRFPFGYGLSYTTFKIEPTGISQNADRPQCITVTTRVSNVGSLDGRLVGQCYVSTPDGENEKPYQSLASFFNIPLKAGQSVEKCLDVPLDSLASYSERSASWVLDAGEYVVRVGDSSRNTSVAGVFVIPEPVVLEKCANRCVPPKGDLDLISPKNRRRPLEEPAVRSAGRLVVSTAALKSVDHSADYPQAEELTSKGRPIAWKDVKEGGRTVEDFVAQLDDVELASVVNGALMDEVGAGVEGGTGVGGSYAGAVSCEASETWSSKKYGVPPMTCADGPSGIRLGNFNDPESKYNPICAQMFHWPCATALAQTWKPEILGYLGWLTRLDMESAGIHGWLAPGLNIQRNPLCGRNFEYFSEDPLIAAVMGGAITEGVESGFDSRKKGGMRTHVTIKHFAVNSQEFERGTQNNVVSERALREIYLRPFELVVKCARPHAVMSSYNKVNGEFAATNSDLLTGILRNEWGFDGVVMTDWWNNADNTRHQKAGNDLIMPGVKEKRDLIARGLADGSINRAEVQRSAVRILKLVKACTK